MNEKLITSKVDGKTCPKCQKYQQKPAFSRRMWRHQDGVAKYKSCVSRTMAGQTLRVRTCAVCEVEKACDDFSKSQLGKSVKEGMVCRPCADSRLRASWENVEAVKPSGEAAADKLDLWREKSHDAAHRWILEAPEIALPSEVTKSYQAILGAHSREQWWEQRPKQVVCTTPATEKLRLLKICHETDLS